MRASTCLVLTGNPGFSSSNMGFFSSSHDVTIAWQARPVALGLTPSFTTTTSAANHHCFVVVVIAKAGALDCLPSSSTLEDTFVTNHRRQLVVDHHILRKQLKARKEKQRKDGDDALLPRKSWSISIGL